MISELINLEQKCYPNSYWDDSMCWGRKKIVIGSDEDMSLTGLTFENWMSGQPDNTANMENKVVMTGKYDYQYGKWNDVAGTSLQHTICEHNIKSDQGSGSKIKKKL